MTVDWESGFGEGAAEGGCEGGRKEDKPRAERWNGDVAVEDDGGISRDDCEERGVRVRLNVE